VGALLLLPLVVPRSALSTVDTVLVYAIAVLGLNVTTGYAGLINVGQAAFLGGGGLHGGRARYPFGLPFFSPSPRPG
jgi:branched-chain amino acid transport system permease protein